MTQKQANMILATVSIGWGTSYIFMKLCIDTLSPLTIVALRFGIAFIVMLAIFSKKIIRVDAKTLKCSAMLGAILFGIFIALLIGMKNTTASSAGFLTSTTVILVPIMQIFITRKWPSSKIILGVMIVMAGLAILTIGDGFSFALSSLNCLISAFLYALHIILTNYFSRKVDALQLGIFQLGFACLYAAVGTFVFETPVLPHEVVQWISILGLALICSAYGFVMQPVAQKHTTPESTGFLFSLEPIFSAIFSFIFLHENMGVKGYLGALLILTGVLIANSSSKKQFLHKEMNV
ncbi:DMT family transporter [Bacillus sp. BRMEA1]|uniref:DMT family transporter n=1 Tax=Neobacillus endophyticus TaxID=2738405 RepID=UPI0015631C90|nr:DMT family transporter [Neobacillus endophyticus]NRD79846.1 DMT family transporter [Neobacillus endophyticus]